MEDYHRYQTRTQYWGWLKHRQNYLRQKGGLEIPFDQFNIWATSQAGILLNANSYKHNRPPDIPHHMDDKSPNYSQSQHNRDEQKSKRKKRKRKSRKSTRFRPDSTYRNQSYFQQKEYFEVC